MSRPGIEALAAISEEIIACEIRFHRQCVKIVELSASGQISSDDEMLLASYITSLTLIRAHRDSLLVQFPDQQINIWSSHFEETKNMLNRRITEAEMRSTAAATALTALIKSYADITEAERRLWVEMDTLQVLRQQLWELQSSERK